MTWESSRRVPDPVAFGAWWWRARRSWAGSPERRERARAAVLTAAGRDVPRAELDRLARRHMLEAQFRTGLLRRPWQQPGRWRGREHLERAAAAGRGVVVSYCHLGPVAGMAVSVARVSPRPCAVAGAWMFHESGDPAADDLGRRWRLALEAGGVTPIRADGGFGQAAAALRAGRVVTIAFDAPGSRTTRFLGREVGLASGTARLAFETGAVVVPVTRLRQGWRTLSIGHPALDPSDHETVDLLHDSLARTHSRLIAERPSDLEDPHRAGWWGRAVT